MFSGDNAFPSAHNLMYGGDAKCKEDNIDRMVNDLEKQYSNFSSPIEIEFVKFKQALTWTYCLE